MDKDTVLRLRASLLERATLGAVCEDLGLAVRVQVTDAEVLVDLVVIEERDGEGAGRHLHLVPALPEAA